MTLTVQYMILFLSIPLFFFNDQKKKSGIDKSDESPRYQHVLALCAFLKQGCDLIGYFF